MILDGVNACCMRRIKLKGSMARPSRTVGLRTTHIKLIEDELQPSGALVYMLIINTYIDTLDILFHICNK